MAPDPRPADWLAALRALLPRGAAWSGAWNDVLGAVLAGIADRLGWIEGRLTAFLRRESLPVTATELLPDWERAFGLPDECCPFPYSQPIEQRRAALRTRLTNIGGQSRAYLIGLAARYGYSISIVEFRPARAGVMRAGDRCRGAAWRFAWGVQGYTARVFLARAGVLRAGDRLRAFDIGVLGCLLQRAKPAHTVLFFAGNDGAPAVIDDFGAVLTDGIGAPIFP
jgi:uncharacterized protein YmfQ (DUF2313 family)